MLRNFFAPKTIFFDLFEKHIALAIAATQQLSLSLDHKVDFSVIARIKPLEHQADEITRQCIEALHKTFITPFDREEIHSLISRMDDIVDAVDAVADCLFVFKIHTVTPELSHFVTLILTALTQMQEAIMRLRDLKQIDVIRTACKEIYEVEHEADITLNLAIGSLFEHEPDARLIIKWKSLYEMLENATDRCADVADVIEGIVLENC